MIALQFALAAPERVSSLILMDTAARSHQAIPNRTLIVIKWLTRRVPMRWHWRVRRLHEIQCATRGLVGREDAAFLRPSRKLAEGIPEADLVLLDDAHHSPQIESPEAWLVAVRQHLNRVRA